MECMKQGKKSFNGPSPFFTFMQKQGNHAKNRGVFMCQIFAWLCETNVDDCSSFKPLDQFASPCEFLHDYAKIMLKAIIR